MQEINAPSYPQELKAPSRSLLSSLLILAASAGLVVWSMQFIQAKMTSVASVDAVINGLVTDLKAPQKGVVSDLAIKTGDIVLPDTTLMTLRNDRVSQTKVEQVQGRIQDKQAELSQAQASLADLQAMRTQLESDRHNRNQVDTLETEKALERSQSDLQEEIALADLAETNRKRSEQLWNEGAIDRASLDKYSSEVIQRKARIQSMQSRIDELQTRLAATQQGYRNLSGAYDPIARMQEINLRMMEQERKIQVLNQEIRSAQAELAQAQADVKREQAVTVKSKNAAVVWQLTAQPSKFVEEGAELGKLLDCSQRWVDAYVEESAMQHIQPGMPATIELNGSASKTLEGKVSYIRSGVGRLQAGQDVAIPIAPNLPRTTQVRVELNADADRGVPDVMCYVGYTAKVSFKLL